jgi:hypothetical protein
VAPVFDWHRVCLEQLPGRSLNRLRFAPGGEGPIYRVPHYRADRRAGALGLSAETLVTLRPVCNRGGLAQMVRRPLG